MFIFSLLFLKCDVIILVYMINILGFFLFPQEKISREKRMSKERKTDSGIEQYTLSVFLYFVLLIRHYLCQFYNNLFIISTILLSFVSNQCAYVLCNVSTVSPKRLAMSKSENPAPAMLLIRNDACECLKS